MVDILAEFPQINCVKIILNGELKIQRKREASMRKIFMKLPFKFKSRKLDYYNLSSLIE